MLLRQLKSMTTGRCCFRKNIEFSSSTIKLRVYLALGVYQFLSRAVNLYGAGDGGRTIFLARDDLLDDKIGLPEGETGLFDLLATLAGFFAVIKAFRHEIPYLRSDAAHANNGAIVFDMSADTLRSRV